MSVRVCGIDPGYDRIGIAVVELSHTGEQLLFSSCITTSRSDTHGARLATIQREYAQHLETYQPHALSIEQLFFNVNQKTALAVAEARGVVIAETASRDIPIFEYTPPQIKLAVTSHGHSDKKHVIDMLHRLVHIEHAIQYDDEYDAIATALTCTACEKHTLL